MTPAQDALLFASFDVLTERPRTKCRPAPGVDARGAPHDRRPPGRRPTTPIQDAPPDDTGESRRPGPGRRSRSRSVSARRCSTSDGVDRFGIAARNAGGARRPARVRRRRDRSGAQRRRPRGAGVRRRPDRVLPRDPQPHPHRARRRGAAVVAVGLRAHVEHRLRADHAPQPHGLQGRHQQPRRRGHRGAAARTCGWAQPTTRRGCAVAPTW